MFILKFISKIDLSWYVNAVPENMQFHKFTVNIKSVYYLSKTIWYYWTEFKNTCMKEKHINV